jgi:Fe-S oxidoreductase
LNHPDVNLVAEQTTEAGIYLEKLHQLGKLRTDFSPLPLEAGYHTPCHQKALSGSSPLARLLSLIPELRLSTIDKGCSGMAGAYGLTSENFQTSLKLGWDLISRMRDGDLNIGVTECSSCKIQMEQGTTIPTLHPLKLLAFSYGLMPGIANKLHRTTGKLIVS